MMTRCLAMQRFEESFYSISEGFAFHDEQKGLECSHPKRGEISSLTKATGGEHHR